MSRRLLIFSTSPLSKVSHMVFKYHFTLLLLLFVIRSTSNKPINITLYKKVRNGISVIVTVWLTMTSSSLPVFQKRNLEVVKTNFETKNVSKSIYGARSRHPECRNRTCQVIGISMMSSLIQIRNADFELMPKTTFPIPTRRPKIVFRKKSKRSYFVSKTTFQPKNLFWYTPKRVIGPKISFRTIIC